VNEGEGELGDPFTVLPCHLDTHQSIVLPLAELLRILKARVLQQFIAGAPSYLIHSAAPKGGVAAE
jgi:hypothetical protein